MATPPRGADAAALGKVKVKVQGEFWIDPLDHVPLGERRAMLVESRQTESPGSFPMCGVGAALKRVTSWRLLEVFMSELGHALKPLSTHAHEEQIVTESPSRCDLKNGQSSGEQICDGTFADRRSMEIRSNTVVVKFEPVQMSSHMFVNFDDRHSFEDSQPHVCQRSYVVPCFGLNGFSNGQRDASTGSDEMVLISPDHTIKVTVEPSDDSVHKDACFPHERETNMTTEAEQEHVDHTSVHKQCDLSPFSSIAGGCSQVDVSLKPDCCCSSSAELRNITPTQGTRTSKIKQGAVAGRQKQSSLKANKQLSDSILSTDPMWMKCKFGDGYCLSQESAAKRMSNSTSVHPESYIPEEVTEVLSDACMDNFSSGIGNLPEKEVQSPAVGQKKRQFKTDSLLHDSSLSASVVMVKVEQADEDADAQLSEIGALRESCLLHPSPNTRGTLQAFICQGNIPSVVHNLQENHKQETCSQETFLNRCKVPLVAERVVNFGTHSQPCVSALSFSHARDKVEAIEDSSNQVHVVKAANDLCRTLLCSQEGSAVSSWDPLSEENCNNQALEANDANHVRTSVFDSRENSVSMSPYTVAEILTKDVGYKQNVSPYTSDLQGNQRCTMFSYGMPEDVPVAVKGKNCSNTANQSPDGAFSFSPGSVKVEPLEEIPAFCSSETTTPTKFSTLTFDTSNKFEGDHYQATLCCTCDMQTIRVGDTMYSDKISANVPSGSNLRDVLPDSVLSAFPEKVKVETFQGNCVGSVSEIETTINFSCSASESSDKAVGMDVCAGMPIGEEQQICCNVTGLLPDSALSAFPMRVKGEPSEEDHVVGDSSKAINCQNDTPSRVCNVQNNQETIISSSEINIPEGTGIIQKQTCMANQCRDSDVSASVIKDVEQLEERCANIISENTVGILNSSYSSSNLILKSEPVVNGIQNLYNSPLGSFSSSDMLLVEAKSEIVNELSGDMLDHMPLTERTSMLAASMVSELTPARKSRCFKQTRVCAVGCDSVDSVKVIAKSSTHRRKRKKTATDSVEIALEEDAPGLLQGLLDRGINLDEIKLYGCEEDVDALDISSNVDSFEELEAVISKLFSERPSSLFKLAPLRPAKGTKAVYCLACLISLIEQTRYLQFRNRPVEWGWCRDLQSFIFVFKMHNRIVLERPEYGYATYFFELVESFPIDWQIKRLVTAMKLTSCSRATLIENKSLLVGVDLSEGEARVLEEYGWRPNTGLGSMLNYCDRVVHDRNERDTSEWRLKIGKLLMDGYDGGCIVKANLPKKVVDYVGNHSPEIKMEI